jgi:Ca-activated chloride channel family protein
MHFLAPAAFALAALLPIIVAMYLLKLRRTEQVVSSTYLWQRMVRDMEANAPWQRLRRNLLLVLQLLFLALLVVTLARPFAWAEGQAGQATILVLDTSASMSASDVAPTRLEAAKVRARQIADGLPEDARVTVIAAGQQARVLLSSSLDRRQVHLAIDSVRAGVGGSDLEAALALASAVAARQPDTEIVVFSDGRVDLGRVAVKGRVRYLPMGLSGENQAISALSVRAMPGGQYLAAFVQVANYGQSDAQRRLGLYADGELVNAYDLEIPAKQQRAVVADDLPPSVEIVEARFLGPDVLALDDRAWAVYRAGDRASAVLISEGNRFLETALRLMPSLEVTAVRPAEVGQAAEEDGVELTQTLARTELVVLDGDVPLSATLSSGSLLYIAPPRSTAFFSVTGRVDAPMPRVVDPTDPLVAHTALGEVSVLEAARLSLPSWARAVLVGDVEGESVPLLLVGQLAGRRIAVLAFDLRRSDLPLQVAFPLLFANLVDWLLPEQGASVPEQVRPGAPVSLSLAPEVEGVSVRTPGGDTMRLWPVGGRVVFADTNELGIYELAWGEERTRFAVSLLSARESDILPADELAVPGVGAEVSEDQATRARQEWWRPIAYAGLAVLLVEWACYHRAAIARLAGWVRNQGRSRREPAQ